jgi:actin-like ATPase involved in cell morphogenesis
MNRICLDLGSEALRVGTANGGVAELRPAQRPVHRGVIVDLEALDYSLTRLVRRRRAQLLVVSAPAGPPAGEVRSSLEEAARLLRSRTLSVVPAPLAALRGAASTGPALVVDLGAELTEVSWVEASGFQIGTSLPWGINDLRHSLWSHLQVSHDVAFPPSALGDHWAGSTVAARCRNSHAIRVIRITTEDVEHILGDGRGQIRCLLQRLERVSQHRDAQHILVGGGAMLPDLRRRLLPSGMHWSIPRHPTHAVVDGLRAA